MKPFAWSWSKLKNYRTCPKRHYEVDIAKNYKESESDALKWGNSLHDAMARRLSKGTALPKTMQHYEDWPQRIAALAQRPGLKLKVEQKLAMTSEFGPAEFFDNGAWYRCVIDVAVIAKPSKAALAFDWKTGGKVQPDFEQLGLTAQVLFAHYPEIDEVSATYVWIGHDTQTTKKYTRDQMAPLWNELWPEIRQMQEAHRTLTYPPKPSGLCKNYCPVTSCPHHGKGSR